MSFSFIKTVKEALAVCRSFLDGVVIFFIKVVKSYMILMNIWKELQLGIVQVLYKCVFLGGGLTRFTYFAYVLLQTIIFYSGNYEIKTDICTSNAFYMLYDTSYLILAIYYLLSDSCYMILIIWSLLVLALKLLPFAPVVQLALIQ